MMLNRKMRRKLAKKTKSKILRKFKNKTILFQDGDKVKLKYDRIINRRNDLSNKYIDFVESNKDKVLTVSNIDKLDFKDQVRLEEDMRWIWHISDLESVTMS